MIVSLKISIIKYRLLCGGVAQLVRARDLKPEVSGSIHFPLPLKILIKSNIFKIFIIFIFLDKIGFLNFPFYLRSLSSHFTPISEFLSL